MREKIPHCSLYSFLIAAVTNHDKFSGLKQCMFFPLQFWWSEMQNESEEAKIKVAAGFFTLEAPREDLQLAFPASRGYNSPWFLAASLQPRLLSSYCLLFLLGPLWGHQIQLKTLNLITSTKSLLPYEVTYSQVSGIRTWRHVGGGEGLKVRRMRHIIPPTTLALNIKEVAPWKPSMKRGSQSYNCKEQSSAYENEFVHSFFPSLQTRTHPSQYLDVSFVKI